MIILDAPYGLTLIQGPSISQYRYKKDSWTSQSCIYFCSQKYLLKECKMFLYLRHFHHMSILARSWTTDPRTMNFTILVKSFMDIIAMQFSPNIYLWKICIKKSWLLRLNTLVLFCLFGPGGIVISFQIYISLFSEMLPTKNGNN